MNVIECFLKEQKDNLKNFYFCFDYDEVIAYRSWKNLSKQDQSMLIKILKYRKVNKKGFITSGIKLGYTKDSILQTIEKAVKVNELNPKVVDFFYDVKEEGGNLVVSSNNSPILLKRCFKEHKIDNFFICIHTPEYANWSWKPEEMYFKTLKDKLRTDYKYMVLYDDHIKNVEALKKLGGLGTYYKTWKMPFKFPKEWR